MVTVKAHRRTWKCGVTADGGTHLFHGPRVGPLSALSESKLDLKPFKKKASKPGAARPCRCWFLLLVIFCSVNAKSAEKLYQDHGVKGEPAQVAGVG